MSQPNPAHPFRRAITIVIAAIIVLVGFVIGRNSGTSSVSSLFSPSGKGQPKDLPVPPKDVAPPPSAVPSTPIVVEAPSNDALLANDFEVSGRAKPGEIVITVKGGDGNAIVIASAAVGTVDRQSGYGRFSTIVHSGTYQGPATIEVALKTAPKDVVSRSVSFGKETAASLDISIFFTKKSSDPNVSCEQTFPVTRKIPAGRAAYREAINALLAGPTAAELAQGFQTSLVSGAKLKSVAANASGVVTADFDRKFQAGVAGSCRVTAIRAQIEATLRQFPEVREVVISVEGNVNTALQP